MFGYKKIISEMTEDELNSIKNIRNYQKNVQDKFLLFQQSLSHNSLSDEDKNFIIHNFDYLASGQKIFVKNIFSVKEDDKKQKLLSSLCGIEDFYFLDRSVFFVILIEMFCFLSIIFLFLLSIYLGSYFDHALKALLPMTISLMSVFFIVLIAPQIISLNINAYKRKDVDNIKKELSVFNISEKNDNLNGVSDNFNFGELVFDGVKTL